MADNRRGGNPLRIERRAIPAIREQVPLVSDAPPPRRPWEQGLVRDPLEALPLAERVRYGPGRRAD
jgi:hypothetical protein